MSEPATTPDLSESSRAGLASALFANLVLQQTEMALLLMGRMPHPESGETLREFDRARVLIDQLEMLEQKTQGNLSKEEAGLLKQSLMTLRMAFVESVDSPAAAPQPDAAKSPPADGPASTTDEEESRKRFTKKY